MLLSVVTVLVGGLVGCSAAPRKREQSDDIPGLQLSNSGVSASFGGYHASAGLGGTLNGGPSGGMFAKAGTPDGSSASAGLGGSVGSGGGLFSQAQFGGGADTSAGASVVTDDQGPAPKNRPNGFYDNVFNIPISVLQAVNQLLGGTPKNEGTKVVHTRAYSASDLTPAGQIGGEVVVSKAVPGRSFFDDIFNIPISALKSVNVLLNNKNGGEKIAVHH